MGWNISVGQNSSKTQQFEIRRLKIGLNEMLEIVKHGSCSSLLKFLNSTLKISIQKQKEQSWHYNLSAPTTTTTTHNF